MAIISLLARLGTSDPIEAYTDMKPIIDAFDFNKFGRGTPKMDVSEIERLNMRIVHQLSYDDVKNRPELDGIDENFWMNVRANLKKVSDVTDWAHVTNDKITTSVADEDKDYIRIAASTLPEGDVMDDTWSAWTGTLKEKTDRKGRGLFMPLRQALTGMDHGPEMDKMLKLLGRDRALRRLEKAAS